MDYNTFYTYGTETSSSSFADWVGALGSLGASDEALMGREGAPQTISRFEQDIDDALGHMYDAMGPLDLIFEADPTVDWQSIFNNAMPYPAPVLTDDTSSTAYSANQPQSPVSDSTLVDSPFTFLPDFDVASAGDSALVDQPIAPSPSPFHHFGFTFQCEPTATILPCDPSPALLQQDHYYDSSVCCQGQYWPGQQQPQHKVGAAGAVAPGLVIDVEVNADPFPFTPMDPTSLPYLPVPSPVPQQDPVVVEDPPPIRTTSKKHSRVEFDAGSNNSACESNNQDGTPTKKKRRQDTTKRFACPYPECDSAHSRTHNLTVHINSVHLGKRSYCCKEPGCSRAFSRKHDLNRHHQSAHTTLGSPRNPNNAKGAKGRKAVKKDEQKA